MNQISNQISDWYLDISLLWIRYLGIKEISRYQDTPTAAWCLWAQSLPCLYLSCVYSLSCLYTWVRRCCETFNGALRLGSQTVSSHCQLTGAVVHTYAYIYVYIKGAVPFSKAELKAWNETSSLVNVSFSLLSSYVFRYVTTTAQRLWAESLRARATRVALRRSVATSRSRRVATSSPVQCLWAQRQVSERLVARHVCGMPCVLHVWDAMCIARHVCWMPWLVARHVCGMPCVMQTMHALQRRMDCNDISVSQPFLLHSLRATHVHQRMYVYCVDFVYTCIRVKLTCCGGCRCFSRESLCMLHQQVHLYVYIWLTHIHTRPSTCTHALLHTYTCAHTYVWEMDMYIGYIYVYTSTHLRAHTHTNSHSICTQAPCVRWREYIHRTYTH